ncbi:MAG: hypothetical protein H0W88_00730 [Parachlamydiaceae bacterium]|nr:hypothetical protein [Parachlamydiaceae bacterium]
MSISPIPSFQVGMNVISQSLDLGKPGFNYKKLALASTISMLTLVTIRSISRIFPPTNQGDEQTWRTAIRKRYDSVVNHPCFGGGREHIITNNLHLTFFVMAFDRLTTMKPMKNNAIVHEVLIYSVLFAFLKHTSSTYVVPMVENHLSEPFKTPLKNLATFLGE